MIQGQQGAEVGWIGGTGQARLFPTVADVFPSWAIVHAALFPEDRDRAKSQ